MKTLDGYIAREMLAPLAIALGVCVLLLVGHTLWTIADVALENQVPFATVAQFALLRIPWAVTLALPVATLLSCAVAVTRLARDSELFALGFSGVPVPRLLLPTLVVGLLSAGASLAVGEFVVPSAGAASENLVRSMVLSERAFALAAGRFIEANPDSYAYALEASPDGALQDVLVFQPLGGGPPLLLTADDARLDGSNLILGNPRVYYTQFEGGFVVSRGGSATIDVSRALRTFWTTRPGLGDMGLRQLLNEIRRARGRGAVDTSRYELQAHWRLALPMACFVFALLAGPMTMRFERGGSLIGGLIAVLCMFAYLLTMLWSHTVLAGLQHLLPPASPWPPLIAAWWGTMFFAAIGVYLLATQR